MRRLFVLTFGLVLCAAFSAAGAVRKQTAHNAVELQAYEDGDTIRAEARLIPQNGWQIYSHKPGDAGLPTEAVWTLYDHRLLGEEWSEGEDILYEGFALNVYRQPALYGARLAKAGGKMPEVSFTWMACKGECFPESVSFVLTPEVFAARADDPAAVPQTAAPSAAPVDNSDRMPAGSDKAGDGWLRILLLAFAGGLVLNFMPCVFPVLFLKIMSAAKETDRRQSAREACKYAAGVLCCFAATAGVLYGLRRTGAEIGWGFQLQSPFFVAAMAALFLLLGLVFLGVIKINRGLRYLPAGSFMTGFLAVLIASPCTAPFMGAALGWALTTARPAYFYYPVFLALGVGYALPFFLAGLYPGALKKILPRPGRWMAVLEKVFALPMFLTCGWLLWVLAGDMSGGREDWLPYTPAAVEEATARGEKAFVNFTAKWCLTCLVNERRVFADREFAEAAEENGVRLFKADWTDRSPEIARALSGFGRGSIPLYVYYDGRGGYEILPQMPSVDDFRRVFSGR